MRRCPPHLGVDVERAQNVTNGDLAILQVGKFLDEGAEKLKSRAWCRRRVNGRHAGRRRRRRRRGGGASRPAARATPWQIDRRGGTQAAVERRELWALEARKKRAVPSAGGLCVVPHCADASLTWSASASTEASGWVTGVDPSAAAMLGGGVSVELERDGAGSFSVGSEHGMVRTTERL